MRQIIADGGERFLFIAPALCEIGFAAGGRAHPIEDRGGNGLQLRRGGAYHINRDASRLRQLRDILGRHQAGVVRTI